MRKRQRAKKMIRGGDKQEVFSVARYGTEDFAMEGGVSALARFKGTRMKH